MNEMKILMAIITREVFGVHQDGEEPVHCVKFSPDGSLLALGSRDNAIYTYQVGHLYLHLSQPIPRVAGFWNKRQCYIHLKLGCFNLSLSPKYQRNFIR